MKMAKDDCFVLCQTKNPVGRSVGWSRETYFQRRFNCIVHEMRFSDDFRWFDEFVAINQKKLQCNYCTCRFKRAEVNLCYFSTASPPAIQFSAMKRTKSVKMLLLPIELLAVGTPFNSFVTRQYKKKYFQLNSNNRRERIDRHP